MSPDVTTGYSGLNNSKFTNDNDHVFDQIKSKRDRIFSLKNLTSESLPPCEAKGRPCKSREKPMNLGGGFMSGSIRNSR